MNESFFATRSEASSAAAQRIGDALVHDLKVGKSAAIVVSGGSTPAPAFRELSQRKLPWDRVTVTLSDERWVSSEHADSNERMLHETLLQNEATRASVLPLYRAGADAATAAERLQDDLQKLPLPFSSVLLGMGEDGHFASLFPDFDGLDEALRTDNDQDFVAVQTAGSPHPRISMTLSALLRSREIILLIFGDGKRQVYEDAKSARNALPVASLLAQTSVPLHVIWAP